MNRKEQKAKRKELLLEVMLHTPMKTKEIANMFQISDGTAWEYVSELKHKGLIYVADYERTQGGPVAKYMSGDIKDAPFPEVTRSAILKQQRYKDQKNSARDVYIKPKPRCDIAAAWLRNPIC